MEPSIRRWDLALFINVEPSRGDVIIYSLTPSFYIAHRYICDYPGMDGYIVTKGDANPTPDPFPVSKGMVKGVVFLILWREVWIPLFTYAAISALIETSRTRIVGLSSTMTSASIIIFIIVVYGFTQPIPEAAKLELPLIHLSRIELDTRTCTLIASYVGNLQLSYTELYIDGVRIPASFNTTHIVAVIPKDIAYRIGSRGWTYVQVYASLNHIGKLVGNYTVKVYPKPLRISIVNDSLLIDNPNGFPVAVNITFKYAYDVRDLWRYSSIEVIVEGCSVAFIDPPEGCRYAYAEVEYVLAGYGRRIQILVKH
ncbi:hypothetical protein KEJ40_06490 [Candidatus Bathyarchaeota archaeon]|nr:hypothetical protein [Candidatus Bathyarchaeota archaeon]